ncbi:hypothetical protein H4Q26_007940 [Puccinia striiformis f. sp. tritici PST-130]|nr:hypothetical protein H4Q26_007940 [Puccinia striiformis f. sp. tritici PST-130]
MDVSPEDDWKLTMDANEKQKQITSCVLPGRLPFLILSTQEIIVMISTMSIFHYLRLGHRRGDISLWRHTSNGQMELESLTPVCPTATQLTYYHDLASATQYQLTAYLAVANSKGRPWGYTKTHWNQSSITYLKWLPSIGNTVRYHYRQTKLSTQSFKSKLRTKLISAYLSSTISVIRISFQSLGEIVLLPLPRQLIASRLHRYSIVLRLSSYLFTLYDDRLCWADCNSWASCSVRSGKVDHDPIKPERRTCRLLGAEGGNRTPAQNVLLVHLYGGLKVALDLLQTLCSSSALLDSPHTVLLQSWKDLVDPAFDAPGLLISMRVRILADIQRVVKILLDIIKANGRLPPEPAAVGSFMAGYMLGTTNTSLDRIAGALTGGVGGMPGSSYMASYALSGGRAPAVPDESRIASLVDWASHALLVKQLWRGLTTTSNLATEFLLASPVLVQRARDERTAATAAAAAPSASTDQPAATEEPSTSEEIDQTRTLCSSPVDPVCYNELASDTNDVSMGKASAEEPGTVEAKAARRTAAFLKSTIKLAAKPLDSTKFARANENCLE